jgi:aminoglycoside phosphotransferase (APT) family kinase protein
VRDVCTSLIDVLVALHRADPNTLGLHGFGRPDGFVARQVALWRRQWDQVKTRELPDLERLHSRLADRTPRSGDAAVLHGDYRIDNVMLDPVNPARLRAVLDWELSALGDPRADIALMCTYRHPSLDVILGIPRRGRATACRPVTRSPPRTSGAPVAISATGRSLWPWRISSWL